MATSLSDPPVTAASQVHVGRVDRFFSITARGSTVWREVIGGTSTFWAMAYILVLNALIIGTVKDATGHYLGGGTTPNLGAIAAATALVAAVMTLLMAFIGRMPFALATGLGLNAFVAFSVASQMSWPEAMGLVVVEGLVITVLVLTGFRTAVFNAVPKSLKNAIAAGIGLFIAIIGFADGGIVRVGNGTVVQLGINGNLSGWPTVVFVVSLLLIAILMVRKVKGAILIGIVASTVLAVIVEAVGHVGAASVKNPDGWQLNVPSLAGKHVGLPDLSLIGHVSFGGFSTVGVLSAVILVFALVLSDFFDVMGTTVGLTGQAGLLDRKGNVPNVGRIFFVDGAAAAVGGFAGVSSATTYVESSAGIGDENGARTGLASVVTGLIFALAILLTPLAQIVPSEAAAPALVVVGVLMMQRVREIDFSDLTIAIPAFLTMVLMPFTYSITNGIGAGFVVFVVLRVAVGKWRSIHPLMWIVSALFVVYFAIEPIRALLHIG